MMPCLLMPTLLSSAQNLAIRTASETSTTKSPFASPATVLTGRLVVAAVVFTGAVAAFAVVVVTGVAGFRVAVTEGSSGFTAVVTAGVSVRAGSCGRSPD